MSKTSPDALAAPATPLPRRVISVFLSLLRPFVALIVVFVVFFLIQWHELGYTTETEHLRRMVTKMDLQTVSVHTIIVGTARSG